MSVKVKKSFLNGALSWYFSKAGCVRLMDDVSLCMEIERDKRCYAFELLFKKGYENDGLNVPKFLQKWFKKIDKKNELYNFAGFAFCFLYDVKGCLQKDFILSLPECDSIFKGILLNAGVSRFKASVISFVLSGFCGYFDRWVSPSSVKNVVCSKVICIDGR